MLPLILPSLLAQAPAWSPRWRSPTLGGIVQDDPAGLVLGRADEPRVLAHPRATAALPRLGERWSLSFEVVYRRLGEAGGRVSLELGGRKLLWTGADADYGKMSSFVGEAMVDTRVPEVGRAYRLTLRREGGVGSVLLDGRLLGRGPMRENPDALFVGGDDSGVLATSTAMEVRGVSLEGDAPSVAPRGEGPARTPPAQDDGNGLLRLALGADATAVPAGGRLRVSARESRLLLPPGAP